MSDIDYEEQAENPQRRFNRSASAVSTTAHRAAEGVKVAAIAVAEAVENTGDRYKKIVDAVDKWADSNRIGRSFLFRERRTKLSVELRAGTITFLMVAYILALNPQILSATGGTCDPSELCDPDSYETLGRACLFRTDVPEAVSCISHLKLSLTTATAATSLIATFIMGYFANLPLALAPGMGINIYLAYQVVAQDLLTYEQAMTAIFLESFIFMALSMSGIRAGLIRRMPENISFATSVGIGLLLAFTGLRNLGVIVFDANTLVTIGGCSESHHIAVYSSDTLVSAAQEVVATGTLDQASPSVYACNGSEMQSAYMWLGISGGALMALLSAWGVKGALFIGVAFITIISWIPGHAASFLGAGSPIPGGQARMDVFKQVVAVPTLQSTAIVFDWSAVTKGHFWVVLFTFLYIDLLDCTGILLSMASLLDDTMRADAEKEGQVESYQPFLNEKKEFRGQQWAFLSDGIGILTASLTGVTPVSVYLESAAGVEDGGRTGVVAIVVSFFFFISLFFAPIFSSIPPYATGPALILVGVMLIAHVDRLDWDDPLESVPAFLTIIIMPFTLSVAYGIIAGLVAYIALHLPGWLFALYKYVYYKHIQPRWKSGSEDGANNNNNTNYNVSPSPSGKNLRRRAVHRKVFGHQSGSEDGASVASFKGRYLGNHVDPEYLNDGMFGSHVAVGSINGPGGGLHRSVSQGSFQSYQHGHIHRDTAMPQASISGNQRDYIFGASAAGSAGGGRSLSGGGGYHDRSWQPPSRTVSIGSHMQRSHAGPIGMARSKTLTDLEQAAAAARVAVQFGHGQGASSSYEGNTNRPLSSSLQDLHGQMDGPGEGNDVKLFGDFQLLDLDLGSDDDDEHMNTANSHNNNNNNSKDINDSEAADVTLFGDFKMLDINLDSDSGDETTKNENTNNNDAPGDTTRSAADDARADIDLKKNSSSAQSASTSSRTESLQPFNSADARMFRGMSALSSDAYTIASTSEGGGGGGSGDASSPPPPLAGTRGLQGYQRSGSVSSPLSEYQNEYPLGISPSSDQHHMVDSNTSVFADPALQEHQEPHQEPHQERRDMHQERSHSQRTGTASTSMISSTKALRIPRVDSEAAVRLKSLFGSQNVLSASSSMSSQQNEHVLLHQEQNQNQQRSGSSSMHGEALGGGGASAPAVLTLGDPSNEDAPANTTSATTSAAVAVPRMAAPAAAGVQSPFDQGMGSWGTVLSPRAQAAGMKIHLPETIVSGVPWDLPSSSGADDEDEKEGGGGDVEIDGGEKNRRKNTKKMKKEK